MKIDVKKNMSINGAPHIVSTSSEDICQINAQQADMIQLIKNDGNTFQKLTNLVILFGDTFVKML